MNGSCIARLWQAKEEGQAKEEAVRELLARTRQAYMKTKPQGWGRGHYLAKIQTKSEQKKELLFHGLQRYLFHSIEPGES